MKKLIKAYNDFVSDGQTVLGKAIKSIAFAAGITTAVVGTLAVLALPFASAVFAVGALAITSVPAAAVIGGAAFVIGLAPAIGVAKLHEMTKPAGKDYVGFPNVFFKIGDFTTKTALAPLRVIDIFNGASKKPKALAQEPAATAAPEKAPRPQA